MHCIRSTEVYLMLKYTTENLTKHLCKCIHKKVLMQNKIKRVHKLLICFPNAFN